MTGSQGPPKGARRPRGSGSLYQRGGVWWVKYHLAGRGIRESTGTANRREAERFLQRRLAEVALGQFIGPAAERVTYEQLVDLVKDDYQLNERRSLRRLTPALARLKESFAGMRALAITFDRLTAHVVYRRSKGAALATIQYELAILRRGFSLAIKRRLLPTRPAFPALNIINARQGFFEAAQLEAVLDELPDYLKAPIEFAALTGWRRAEVFALTWDRVDLAAGVVRLEAGTTKNGEGRTFPLDVLPALKALLQSQRNYTETVESALARPVPVVFHRFGQPIKDHYAAWRSACRRAKVPGRMMHDLRRTAVRNLERAGVSRSVAMKLTGHKTEAVYKRYAIVSEADLREGVTKLAKLGTVWAQPDEK